MSYAAAPAVRRSLPIAMLLAGYLVGVPHAAWAQAPGAPGTLVATIKGSSLTLEWSLPTSGGPPAGYRIEVGSRSGASDLGTFDVGLVTKVGPVPLPPVTLFIRVRASNSIGLGPPTNEVSVSAMCAPPGSPSDFTVSVANINYATFHWKAPAQGGAAAPNGYLLIVGSTSGSSDIGTFDVGNVTSLPSIFVPSGHFHFRVAAYNGCGVSGASNDVELLIGNPQFQRPEWGLFEPSCCPSAETNFVAQISPDGSSVSESKAPCAEVTAPRLTYSRITPGAKQIGYQRISGSACKQLNTSGLLAASFAADGCYWVTACPVPPSCENLDVRVIAHPACEFPLPGQPFDLSCPANACNPH